MCMHSMSYLGTYCSPHWVFLVCVHDCVCTLLSQWYTYYSFHRILVHVCHVCICVYVCMCVYECVYVCVCCVHVYYMCICMCVYVCVFCSFLAELITTVLTVSWAHSEELLYITSHYTQLCAPKMSCYCCSSKSSTTTTFDTPYTGVLGWYHYLASYIHVG